MKLKSVFKTTTGKIAGVTGLVGSAMAASLAVGVAVLPDLPPLEGGQDYKEVLASKNMPIPYYLENKPDINITVYQNQPAWRVALESARQQSVDILANEKYADILPIFKRTLASWHIAEDIKKNFFSVKGHMKFNHALPLEDGCLVNIREYENLGHFMQAIGRIQAREGRIIADKPQLTERLNEIVLLHELSHCSLRPDDYHASYIKHGDIADTFHEFNADGEAFSQYMYNGNEAGAFQDYIEALQVFRATRVIGDFTSAKSHRVGWLSSKYGSTEHKTDEITANFNMLNTVITLYGAGNDSENVASENEKLAHVFLSLSIAQAGELPSDAPNDKRAKTLKHMMHTYGASLLYLDQVADNALMKDRTLYAYMRFDQPEDIIQQVLLANDKINEVQIAQAGAKAAPIL